MVIIAVLGFFFSFTLFYFFQKQPWLSWLCLPFVVINLFINIIFVLERVNNSYLGNKIELGLGLGFWVMFRKEYSITVWVFSHFWRR